jgi:hypothetical protein
VPYLCSRGAGSLLDWNGYAFGAGAVAAVASDSMAGAIREQALVASTAWSEMNLSFEHPIKQDLSAPVNPNTVGPDC